MTDEQLQRTRHFTQLKWALQSLVQAGSVQPLLFPEQALGADDLAFGFDHWSSLVRDAYATELSPAQASSLEVIAQKLATMSRDGAEFDADLWTDSSLATSEHWADVRQLALSALIAFGWAADDPPGAADE